MDDSIELVALDLGERQPLGVKAEGKHGLRCTACGYRWARILDRRDPLAWFRGAPCPACNAL